MSNIKNAPQSPSRDELREIYNLVGHKWGYEFESPGEFNAWAESVYAVKFNFHSGAPGYVGDLFIVQGDMLTDEPPIMLIRADDDRLKALYYGTPGGRT